MFLNEEQKLVVAHKKGPAIVLAGAGSGKSTTLIERAAHLVNSGVHPSKILLVTFSKKAADSLQEKILKRLPKGTSNILVSTFHGLGSRILRESIKYTSEVSPGFEIIKSWEQKKLINEICDTLGVELDFKLILNIISKLKKELISYRESFEYLDNSDVGMADTLSQIYHMYENIKTSRNLIDFDDMILIPNRLLNNVPEVRAYWQNKFDYLMIDECQDNNLAQFKIAESLAANHRNIMMIGDDLQSIYSFQHSRPDVTLQGFYETFKAKLLKLSINYRSSKEIIDIANTLAGHIGNPFGKVMNPHIAEGGSPVFWNPFNNSDEEATFIALQIKDMKKEFPQMKYKDFAILYRTNRQSRAVEQALVSHEIPYVVYTGESFFCRKEVQDILAFLKIAHDPLSANLEIEQVLNISSNHYPTATRRLGKQFISELRKSGGSLWNSLRMGTGFKKYQKNAVEDFKFFISQIQTRSSLKEKTSYIIDNSYTRYLRNEYGLTDEDGDMKTEVLDEILKVFSKFSSFEDLYIYIQKMISSDTKQKQEDFDGVQVMTAHKSKGLEWPTVFVIGMNNGMLPHMRSGVLEKDGTWYPIDITEERRICYVAITRAKKYLFMSSVQDSGEFSIFLKEMGILAPSVEDVLV